MKAIADNRGFTLVELLVVASIVALVAGLTIVGFQSYAQYQRFDQEVATVRAALMDARTSARAAVNDEAHGIKLTTNNIVLFSGNGYVVGDPSNETVALNAVTVAFALTNGVDEIVFDKLSGTPSATGTITLTGTNYYGSSTLEISATSVIQ